MRLFLLFLLLSILGPPAAAGGRTADVKVAVAANFTDTAKALGTAFEKKTGHKIVYTFGASGQFYAQIAHGAPFEVFLSADAERPQKLEADGLTVAGSRFVYAYGKLVLWSADKRVDRRGLILAKGNFEKIAIADPAAAPYGIAAVETMKKMGLYDKLQPKIVKGSSISQTFTFVSTGAAEIGFIALSQAKVAKGGSMWLVPESHYTPIDQQAVLLKTGAGNPAARAYLDFLKSPEAVRIIRAYGYEVR
ncbi:molybdate ABC transporter substrate-binding protein [Asticcacaulis sp. BYS171W]|uniref:Molybdate ABC transporter substrate-binding protein n=1 Tax=Asticcacaulis aquaticus TaxID=2984212 RepID=A0ABT5HWP1_9CAUL|nr:molybdate ABC transporter substrate-binding protein [Asticcacaulis aquaticus]MDC7684453.1 molybdate ABC transporter substrate-binding protein [Asticcacaulis aquaticus]